LYARLVWRRLGVGVEHEELAVEEVVELARRAEVDQVEEEQRRVGDAAALLARDGGDDPVVRVAAVLPVRHHAARHGLEQVGAPVHELEV